MVGATRRERRRALRRLEADGRPGTDVLVDQRVLEDPWAPR